MNESKAISSAKAPKCSESKLERFRDAIGDVFELHKEIESLLLEIEPTPQTEDESRNPLPNSLASFLQEGPEILATEVKAMRVILAQIRDRLF